MSPKQQRLARLYQGKSRGDSRSYKTELENVQLLLAWEAGDLSEGQVATMLGVDRVSLRMMRDGAKAAGMALAEELAGEKRNTHTAHVVFVAIDDYGRPKRVPRLVAESPEEQARYAAADAYRREHGTK